LVGAGTLDVGVTVGVEVSWDATDVAVAVVDVERVGEAVSDTAALPTTPVGVTVGVALGVADGVPAAAPPTVMEPVMDG
jgi:hypothetical protein